MSIGVIILLAANAIMIAYVAVKLIRVARRYRAESISKIANHLRALEYIYNQPAKDPAVARWLLNYAYTLGVSVKLSNLYEGDQPSYYQKKKQIVLTVPWTHEGKIELSLSAVISLAHELGHAMDEAVSTGRNAPSRARFAMRSETPTEAMQILDEEVTAWRNAEKLLRMADFDEWPEYYDEATRCLHTYVRRIDQTAY